MEASWLFFLYLVLTKCTRILVGVRLGYCNCSIRDNKGGSPKAVTGNTFHLAVRDMAVPSPLLTGPPSNNLQKGKQPLAPASAIRGP
jgi:hypothetical protein